MDFIGYVAVTMVIIYYLSRKIDELNSKIDQIILETRNNESKTSTLMDETKSFVKTTKLIHNIRSDIITILAGIKFIKEVISISDSRQHRIYRTVSAVCRQFLGDNIKKLVDKVLCEESAERFGQVSEMKDLDLPRPLKGVVSEDVIFDYLQKAFPDAQVVHTGNESSSPDIEFSYRGKMILVEIKAWHFDVDSKNIERFKEYLSRPKYSAGIIINLDDGRFIMDNQEISGIQLFDGKIAYFLCSPGFNLESLRQVLHVICH